MHEMIEKIEYLMEKQPEKVIDFIKETYKHNPDAVERLMEYVKTNYGGYIPSKKKYEELVERLKWSNGNGRGAKWSFEDIKKNARINFDNVDFTEFDYAYLVNMLYAKCCKEFNDPSMFLKLAKCLLEDPDEETKLYKGAYAEKHKHSKHGEQSYYGDYDEENRRKRRYRSENDYDVENYDEESRRGVRRYRYEEEPRRIYDSDRFDNRYYKETNMGFNT